MCTCSDSLVFQISADLMIPNESAMSASSPWLLKEVKSSVKKLITLSYQSPPAKHMGECMRRSCSMNVFKVVLDPCDRQPCLPDQDLGWPIASLQSNDFIAHAMIFKLLASAWRHW